MVRKTSGSLAHVRDSRFHRDHLCQQLEDDDQQKVLRCFQALRLPAECLKSIVHGIETKDLDPELKELLEDVTQVLPTLVEGSQTAVQLAMSNGEPETVTWQVRFVEPVFMSQRHSHPLRRLADC